MAKHGIKLTDEILDFNTVEDFAAIRAEYKQKQQVRFYCTECKEPVVRNVERIQSLISHDQFTHLCRNCQRKATSQRLYGCDSPTQALQTKEKNRKTREEKFGGWNSDKQRQAIKETFEKHSAEIIAKREQTCLEKAGVTNMNKTKETRDKIKQTCLERFGTTSSLAAKSVKDKIKETCLQKYGVENAHQSSEIIQKTKETCKERYGAESYFASEIGKEKIKQVFLEKHGVENPSQVKEVQAKKNRKYFYENMYFDSSWEIALWIYAKDHGEDIEREPCTLDYEFAGKVHKYYPDFRYKGELVELKGSQLYNIETGKVSDIYANSEIIKQQVLAKIDCAKRNGVKIWGQYQMYNILKYIKEKYGPNYLQQFRRTNVQ